ncbi:hypothetical protein ITJ58_18150 [Curtobacterium flaccumfaciens]|uniref:hypothetical protein n=1 Tax=Curtobacterium flaccumfaciens TaxID=2035 RepID=UPI00188A4676|nr:hypothetical protein [Curtobacterium flaccumfaciens]MBF4595688.1 hypothetical protein [Curtobacterium flaccumfaciens]
MSEPSGREIPAPPRRHAGASTLLRANRTPRVTAEAEQPSAGERDVAPPPPRPARQRPQQQMTSPAPEEADLSTLAAVKERSSEPTPVVAETKNPPATESGTVSESATEPAGAVAPTVAEPARSRPSTPYTRRLGEASEDLTDDDIVKVTFEIRKGDREAFNAAHAAAKLFEGYPFPKDLIVAIYNAETKRLQDQYNNGNPFPRSGKKAPRGRPIQSER